VAKASEVITPAISLQQFLEHPERILNERQKRWFQPLVPVSAWTSKILVRLNRSLMYRLFRLHVEGLEHVSQQSQFVLIPNHYSYLDPFLIAAALDGHRLRQTTYWGGWVGVTFRTPLQRLASRLAGVVPIDPKRECSLVWLLGQLYSRIRQT